MGSQLHQALRKLCLDIGWKYAVFWELKHVGGTLLSLEGACYDNDDYQQSSCAVNAGGNLHSQNSSNDPLGLAVAEMSYHIYSLGEGVVGQVAFTGKHQWILTAKCVTDSSSSLHCLKGWQSQCSAGIKTIAVVAVLPHGVVQLGAFDEIQEDLSIVNKIREVVFELQESLLGSQVLMPDISTRTLISRAYHGFIHNVNQPTNTREIDFGASTHSYVREDDPLSRYFPAPVSYQNKVIEMNKFEQPGMAKVGVPGNFHPPISGADHVEKEKHEQPVELSRSQGQLGSFKNLGEISMNMGTISEIKGGNSRLNDFVLRPENSSMLSSYLSSEILNSITCDNVGEMLSVQELSNLHNDLSTVNDNTHMFCAGDELSEALGPAFCELSEALGPEFGKQNANVKWGSGGSEADKAAGLSEGTVTGSLLTENSDTGHLLEAVVANFKNDEVDKKNYTRLKTEVFLNRENVSESCASVGSLSTGYPLDCKTFNSLNSSASFGAHYSKGFSSTSCSRTSENLERPRESGKVQRKRARPGESCRPRPRDRQLIQDRIKELRELVPNGSKCSIDSLLERTIKHMIFMQCITKQADKISTCINPKGPLLEGQTCTNNSSWAVEVDDLKAWPIMVENINMNGQMLVEMACGDGGQFLEISEAIRSMNLTILKGVTESYGEKTWIRFLVESQNNRSLRRMDILWSLIQLLQTK